VKNVIGDECRGAAIEGAATGEEALSRIAAQMWKLVVVDVSDPLTEGFFVAREVIRRQPDSRVVIFATRSDSSIILRARQVGASGCVSEDAGRSELVMALRTVLAGGTYFDQSVSFTKCGTLDARHLNLSSREYLLLRAFADGKRVGAIAAEYQLSVKTVSTYKRRLLDKLQLNSIADVVLYAADHGLFRISARAASA
jgi:DNA-binding NarL/FixJ family response regulator